jgi:Amt family ammonium transporter
LTGGIAALVGAILVGPRNGRFENPSAFQPHDVSMVVLGTFILWFGWYGFNCGSTLSFSDSGTAAQGGLVAMNTTMSAAAGGLTVFLLRLIEAIVMRRDQLYDLVGLCNGILVGLVAVCAGVGAFEPGMAMLVGSVGGIFYELGHWLMIYCKIDDPLDAFSVHGMGGMTGVILRPLLATDMDGRIMAETFGAHFAGMFAIIAWSAGFTAIILVPFKVMNKLCYDQEAQDSGTDSHCSPPKAYSSS